MSDFDMDEVKTQLSALESDVARLRRDMDLVGRGMERLAASCQGEGELLDVLNRERRYLQSLRSMVDDFPVVRQMKRRIPLVEIRLRDEADQTKQEDSYIARRADETLQSIESVLRQFLR